MNKDRTCLSHQIFSGENQVQPKLAAIACVWRDEEILVIRRAKPPLRWGMPGGHVERGEKLIEAAKRECLEETSIEASLTHFVDFVEVIREDAHFVIGCFTGHWISGEPKAGDDAAEALFMHPKHLLDLDMVSETRQLIEKARKLLR
jgi:8-oxo-dGTP diphosphatase